ncbi:50S ribosomal protein L11 methyltransferase [bacterium]|nr:50S ribosomal protein L11 methyltransferase [bacterium]
MSSSSKIEDSPPLAAGRFNKNAGWFEISIPCDADCREAVSNFLFEQGAGGITEADDRIAGSFCSSLDSAAVLRSARKYCASLREMGFKSGDPELRRIPLEDWSLKWREHFRPVLVTSRIIVKPPWAKRAYAGRILIDIMPRMAFGTGSHETTRLCLELMERYVVPGMSVLDIGTGSGILAIAAARLGAGRVIAVDNDGVAIENCNENILLNHVEAHVTVLEGTLESVGERDFGLVVANINRPVLLEMLLDLPAYLRPDGRLILSGLLIPEMEAVRKTAHGAGFHFLEEREKGEWAACAAAMGSR